MNILTDCIRADTEYGHLLHTIKTMRRDHPLPVVAAGLSEGAADALTVSLLEDLKSAGFGCALIVCSEEKECTRCLSVLGSAGIRAVFFPARDLTLYNLTASHEFEHERLKVLSGYLSGIYDVVLTTPDAALSYTIPAERLKAAEISVWADENLDVGRLTKLLMSAGYVRVDMVEVPGQFALRGGIVDIYPPHAEYSYGDETRYGSRPVRIELFGDEIDRIGTFDPESQRFIEGIAGLKMTPARELLADDDAIAAIKRAIAQQLKKAESSGDTKAADELCGELAALEADRGASFLDKHMTLIYPERQCLLDYFPAGSPVFIRNTPAVNDRLKSSEWLMNQNITELLEGGTLAGKYAEYSKPQAAFEHFCDTSLTLHLDSLSYGLTGRRLGGLFGFRTKHTVSYAGNFQLLCDDLDSYTRGGYRVLLEAENGTAAKNLHELLVERGFKAYLTLAAGGGEFTVSTLPAGSILVLKDAVIRGYELTVPKIAVLSTEPEGRKGSVGGTKIKQRSRRRPGTEVIMSYNELNVGDLVVHETYGIGQYMGIENLTVGGVSRDYIKIRYAGSDRLFLPVDKMDKVSRYIGTRAEDGQVKLSRFGSAEWGRAKARAKAAAKDIAKDLIKLYAERMRREGFAFPPDDDFQHDFEAAFEYEETASQLEAAEDIKKDMIRRVPMDRLLCGDVGYGKTEVAFRAAYKAILGGKQVAMLVPTTILALQHYQTALSRFRGFPVKIDMVSRFRTAKQQKATLRALKRGDIDFIIGTHRLLSNDVEFKNLGLLIVDEEQRFGVAQKEKIKKLCGNIDVLTLTATPIPRTLNMAMEGICDISVLDEAPGDRLPVQTYVLEYDELIIIEAIRRELRRGGQVFYLHNTVEDIDSVAANLRRALPEAEIVTAHGKMEKSELEDIWERMLLGKIDVLVSTTIIETGVDVPNANTLIVDNAHRLGLSQLHQIRGRVGRSSRRAYAYFTYPKNLALSEIAQKRLEAVREYAEFGAGFRIALRDLELRGAGNLLGTEQHGHLDAVGYDLYIKLLKEAVLEEKGETIKPKPDCTVTLDISAFIPASYIESTAQRIALYKRIAMISSEEDLRDITDELCDRFGEPPRPVSALLSIALLRAKAIECDITKVVQEGDNIRLYQDEVDALTWFELAKEYPNKLRLLASPVEHVLLRAGREGDIVEFLSRLFSEYLKIKNSTV
ncbi:MAG: transcription-repair coupling factor [Eubacteriales bacterium]|jgi:transcription-repair coupling factor (superfamily II helicase)